MQLSVLMATRNNSGMLMDFLDAISLCSKPESWELIIVDNASEDDTKDVIMRFCEILPITYLYQELPGKSISLNRGLSRAMGDIVLFTDDDILPDKEWLVNHLRTMHQYPDINILGGKITVDKSKLPSWLAKSYNLRGLLVSEHDKGNIRNSYAEEDYPFGPNMSVRRKCLIGHERPWPEYIGPGTKIPVGDETVFCKNISSQSASDRLYSPECIVEHRMRIEKLFFIRSVKRCFIGGYTASRYTFSQGRPEDAFSSLVTYSYLRLLKINSIGEFICVVSRAMGYFWGKIAAG